MTMLQKIILVVLTAFTVALLGETVLAVVNVATGIDNTMSELIELGVAWLVVLVTGYLSVWHSVTHRSW